MKTYLVVYMTETDGKPVMNRMTAEEIKEKFDDGYLEDVAIIEGNILKDFNISRWPRELETKK